MDWVLNTASLRLTVLVSNSNKTTSFSGLSDSATVSQAQDIGAALATIQGGALADIIKRSDYIASD